MTTYTTKKSRDLAARLAAAQAEQDAHEAQLKGLLERTGNARVALVEDLLERFNIAPVAYEPRRNKRTQEIVLDNKTRQPKMVNPDPDEAIRMQRLVEAIDATIEAAERTEVAAHTHVTSTAAEHTEASTLESD